MVGEQAAIAGRASANRVSYGELFRFYLPLAIQAASQSLTYPLVASVASHGPGGTLNLTGLAQSNLIMGLLFTLVGGIITTGMVYGKTKAGYARVWQINLFITIAVVLAQALLCLPSLAHFTFHHLIGLPVSIERPAYLSLIASAPLLAIFCLRLPYQACLYAHGKTQLANGATLLRILFTVVLVPVFIALGWVGPVWAVVAQAIPVAGELLLSWHFARPLVRALPTSTAPPPTHRELLSFTMPLSVGGAFLSMSGIVIAGIMVHAPDPERMLPAYYLAYGLAGPAALAASRVQPVAISFLPRNPRGDRVLSFSLLMGALMGGIPLLFIIPGLSDVYYTAVQKCPPNLFPLVRISAIGMLFHPLTMGFRAFFEGRAALLKKPVAILTGQVVYFGILTGVALLCIQLQTPGNLLAPIGFFTANIIAALMIHFATTWGDAVR